MDGPARTPPRFVPTLTAVVDLEEEAQIAVAPPMPSQPVAPVLEEVPVVQEVAQHLQDAPTWAAPQLMHLSLDVAAPEPFAQFAEAGQRPPPAPVLPPEPESAPAPVAVAPEPEPEPVFVPQLRVEPTLLVNAEPMDAVEPAPSPAIAPDSFKALSRIDEADAFRLEEELLHRVLQRVDLSLEDRLTEVVSTAVQQQLDAMVPRLRQEVEVALRELVVQAMAHELSETPGSATHSRTKLGLN